MTVKSHALEAFKPIIEILRKEGMSWPLIEKKLRLIRANGMNAWRKAGYTHPKGSRGKSGSSLLTPRRKEVLHGALLALGGIFRVLNASGVSWREIEEVFKLRKNSGMNAHRISRIAA